MCFSDKGLIDNAVTDDDHVHGDDDEHDLMLMKMTMMMAGTMTMTTVRMTMRMRGRRIVGRRKRIRKFRSWLVGWMSTHKPTCRAWTAAKSFRGFQHPMS